MKSKPGEVIESAVKFSKEEDLKSWDNSDECLGTSSLTSLPLDASTSALTSSSNEDVDLARTGRFLSVKEENEYID